MLFHYCGCWEECSQRFQRTVSSGKLAYDAFPLEEVVFHDADITMKSDIEEIWGGMLRSGRSTEGSRLAERCISCLLCSGESSCLLSASPVSKPCGARLPPPQQGVIPRHGSLTVVQIPDSGGCCPDVLAFPTTVKQCQLLSAKLRQAT